MEKANGNLLAGDVRGVNNFCSAAGVLFYVTGLLMFAAVFLWRNDLYVPWAKMVLYFLDLPFMFFATAYFIFGSNVLARDNEFIKGSVNFFAVVFFAVVLFYHLGYPDIV